MPPEAPRPTSMPRQGTTRWAQRLPLPHPGEPPSWPTSWRPHDYSRARQSCPGAPTTTPPLRPRHLESLPAFVLPAASSPDEESSSSDSSDCRSSTMERRGPGEGREEGMEGARGREGGSGLHVHPRVPSTPRATWSSLTPRPPKHTQANPPRRFLWPGGACRLSPSTAPVATPSLREPWLPPPLPSWPSSQASGPWPKTGPQGPSIAKGRSSPPRLRLLGSELCLQAGRTSPG